MVSAPRERTADSSAVGGRNSSGLSSASVMLGRPPAVGVMRSMRRVCGPLSMLRHKRPQVVGPKDPGIYYVATIVSETYEHPVQPSDLAHFRWRTDIRFNCRIRPPLLRSELLEDVQLGSFRPFRGFQGSNVPVPPDVAAALAARAAPRLEPLSPENG